MAETRIGGDSRKDCQGICAELFTERQSTKPVMFVL